MPLGMLVLLIVIGALLFWQVYFATMDRLYERHFQQIPTKKEWVTRVELYLFKSLPLVLLARLICMFRPDYRGIDAMFWVAIVFMVALVVAILAQDWKTKNRR